MDLALSFSLMHFIKVSQLYFALFVRSLAQGVLANLPALFIFFNSIYKRVEKFLVFISQFCNYF